MKKIFITALVIVTIAASAFAKPTKVNYLALKSFGAEFKNASEISWTSNPNFIKATFVYEEQRMEAFYTPAGEKIGVSRGISVDELPVKAKRAFAKQYNKYNVKEAILFEGVEENAYFINAENETENVIVKVMEDGSVSVFKKTRK
jgi:hypothetical protein